MVTMPCVFCRRDVPLTGEHVFPQWCRPFLGNDGDSGTHTRIEIRAGESRVEESYPGRAATRTIRSVCGECNNGWMSRLEDRAKPLLVSILQDHARTYYATGRTVLATWFVKTALIEGSKFTPLLPQEFYAQLRQDQRPSRHTYVWLGATPYREQHYADFRPMRVHADDSPPPPDPNAYSAVVSLGYVASFVVSWIDREPSTARLMRDFAPALVPLWPLTEATAAWPPQYRLDFHGLDKLSDAVVSEDEVGCGRGRPQ